MVRNQHGFAFSSYITGARDRVDVVAHCFGYVFSRAEIPASFLVYSEKLWSSAHAS